jgi:hypothetical protein
VASNNDGPENGEYAAFARRVIRGLGRRVGEGDIDALPDLLELHALIDEVTASRGRRAARRAELLLVAADRRATRHQPPSGDATVAPTGQGAAARQPGGQPVELR